MSLEEGQREGAHYQRELQIVVSNCPLPVGH